MFPLVIKNKNRSHRKGGFINTAFVTKHISDFLSRLQTTHGLVQFPLTSAKRNPGTLQVSVWWYVKNLFLMSSLCICFYITQSQNYWGWKALLDTFQSNPLMKESTRASYPGLYTIRISTFPGMAAPLSNSTLGNMLQCLITLHSKPDFSYV